MIDRVREAVQGGDAPAVTLIAQRHRDPFRTLVSTLLSLRTKDAVTAEASRRLFERAADPQAVLELSEAEIARLIYPVGFYRTKARRLREVARALLERHGGRVPDSLEELLELPGVGRKTANLVLTEAFRKPGICVDTHVHRIVNIWGFVTTRSPDETEQALRAKLPRRHWLEINELLVRFGQTICLPVSPWCSRCPVAERCPRLGVGRSR